MADLVLVLAILVDYDDLLSTVFALGLGCDFRGASPREETLKLTEAKHPGVGGHEVVHMADEEAVHATCILVEVVVEAAVEGVLLEVGGLDGLVYMAIPHPGSPGSIA